MEKNYIDSLSNIRDMLFNKLERRYNDEYVKSKEKRYLDSLSDNEFSAEVKSC